MTTYIFNGLQITYSESGDPETAIPFDLTVVANNANASISYSVIATDVDNLPTVDFMDDFYSVSLTNSATGEEIDINYSNNSYIFDDLFGYVTWSAGTSSVLVFTNETINTDFAFFVEGPEPAYASLSDIAAFESTITAVGQIESGPLAPNTTFTLGDLDAADVTEDDVWTGSSALETIFLGIGDDEMHGRGGRDKLYGGLGKDEIRGNYGNDRLDGGIGQDKLYGNQGKDVLEGGKGKDVLFGGSGEDTFLFRFDRAEGFDRIKDYEDGIDIIKFKGGTFADLTIEADGANVTVAYDNGTIFIKGVDLSDITEADFLFV